MARIARQRNLSRPDVWLVIAGNALWVMGSVGLLIGGWVSPNLLGHTFVIAQALTVVLLARYVRTAPRSSSLLWRGRYHNAAAFFSMGNPGASAPTYTLTYTGQVGPRHS